MAPQTLPSQEYLCQCFSYDRDTGVLTWRERPRAHFSTARAWAVINRRQAGKEVGRRRAYGIAIGIGRHRYTAGRIIWKLVTGEDVGLIDHRDRDPLNNSFGNLRPATHQQNMQNSKTRKHSTTQIKGVCITGSGSFGARITANGQTTWLGSFPTAELAHDAYCEAALRAFGQFWTPG